VSTTEENKARFRSPYEEVLNQGDVSVVDELIAPDFFNHAAPPATSRGPESMRWLATMLRTTFSDLHFTIEELVAEGDIVAGRLIMSGTHEGAIMGMPPTGCSVRQDHMHFVRLRDGKAVEHWGKRDDLGMMQQMSVIPEPGQLGNPTLRSPYSP
jgi:predicted ester cyclase